MPRNRNVALLLLAALGASANAQRSQAALQAKAISAAQPYSAILSRYCNQIGVDPALVDAVLTVESNGQINAQSSAGAMGLMQLMPDTCIQYGVTDPFDPDQNIRGGVSVLATHLLRYNGDITKTLAAYNSGTRHADDGSWAQMPGVVAYIQSVAGIYQALRELETPAASPPPPPTTPQPRAIPSAPPEHFVDEMFATIKGSHVFPDPESLAENGALDDAADTLIGEATARSFSSTQLKARAATLLKGTRFSGMPVTVIYISNADPGSFTTEWAKQPVSEGKLVGLSHSAGPHGHTWIVLII